MKITPYSDKIEKYLVCDNTIDFNNKEIIALSHKIAENSANQIEYIKNAFEYVRDNIFHSDDIKKEQITCTASEVLRAGHGICFAKSHLLVALLRCRSIPSGFCYQKLILDDETAPVLIYHGLTGVYIDEYKKWIRLDERGNKEGVNAQFSTEDEQLAFPVRTEKGEKDIPVVYPDPDKKVLDRLTKYKTRTELWNDLPTDIAYDI